MSKARAYTFTLNNPSPQNKEDVKQIDCKYLVCGEEEGESGTPHLQGYVQFPSPRSFNAVKKLFSGNPHLEVAKGTGAQNLAYCTKEGNILVQRGTMPQDPKQAGAAYWEDMLEKIKTGKKDEIDAKAQITLCHQIEHLAKQHAPKLPSIASMDHEWYYGASGTGKSRKAREENPEAYIKGLNKWWDSYQGEDVVIIEDLDKFNVAMGGDLKRWLDHYSFPAEIKGGGMNIRPKKIIITSNYSISEIWEDQQTVEAITRRCKVTHFPIIKSGIKENKKEEEKEEKPRFTPDFEEYNR